MCIWKGREPASEVFFFYFERLASKQNEWIQNSAPSNFGVTTRVVERTNAGNIFARKSERVSGSQIVTPNLQSTSRNNRFPTKRSSPPR